MAVPDRQGDETAGIVISDGRDGAEAVDVGIRRVCGARSDMDARVGMRCRRTHEGHSQQPGEEEKRILHGQSCPPADAWPRSPAATA
jgi:hypothetical protein